MNHEPEEIVNWKEIASGKATARWQADARSAGLRYELPQDRYAAAKQLCMSVQLLDAVRGLLGADAGNKARDLLLQEGLLAKSCWGNRVDVFVPAPRRGFRHNVDEWHVFENVVLHRDDYWLVRHMPTLVQSSKSSESP